MDLVCPAGNLTSLKAAVDAGADAVYLGFRDATNARNFEGLNFSERDMRDGIGYAHARHRQVFLALNTYPQPGGWDTWRQAVDRAAAFGVDALIAADIGVLDYASSSHPDLPLHLSVQGSATSYREALCFYHEQFGILPRADAAARALACPGPPGSGRTARCRSRSSALAVCVSWSRGAVCCRHTPPANRPTPTAAVRRRHRCSGWRHRGAWRRGSAAC